MKKTKLLISGLSLIAIFFGSIQIDVMKAMQLDESKIEANDEVSEIDKLALSSTPLLKEATGANDTAMDEAMSRAMSANLNIAANKDWITYLNNQFVVKANDFQWTDTSKIEGVSKWEIEDAADEGSSRGGVAYKDNNGNVEDVMKDPWVKPILNLSSICEIYSAQQLKYALMTWPNTKIEIKLQVDLDLQGNKYGWSENNKVDNDNYYNNVATVYKNLTFNGNNHTIYNIGGKDRTFLGRLETSVVKDLNIVSAKMVKEKTGTNSFDNYGLFMQTNSPNLIRDNLKSTVNNLTIKNSLFFCGGDSTQTLNRGGYLSPIGLAYNSEISDYYTMNNCLYGGAKVHVGGATARTDYSKITSSFSVDSTIVCTYEHSGGFIACTDGALRVEDCFTNNKVYGDKGTGVFIGASTNINNSASNSIKGTNFERCYSSGSVEGTKNLGGFIGYSDNDSSTGDPQPLSFKDCYSTSIVGMKAGGENLGGFIGNIPSGDLPSITFTNCYAAGEVGSIDTEVSAERTNFKTVGGFVGNYTPTDPAKIIFNNCYYDKQTTGMRGWETGQTRDPANNQVTGEVDVEGQNNIVGIKGVLTSDSKKSGIGLASNPKAGDSGFAGLDDNWVYDANLDGGEGDGKHNCEYPQLKSFVNGTDMDWGKNRDLVKAFSLASAATIHQQVWDRCINPDHASLSAATYDTVRDLTLQFTMTSYINDKNDEVKINWLKDDTTTTLYGNSNVPIIGYFSKFYNETYDRDYFTSDDFAPGIEWLSVKIKVNGVEGNRRLRVVPTTNIKSGEDKLDLVSKQKYNHALDVKFAKSSGARMNVDKDDVTQGVYPDTPINAGDDRLDILKNIMVPNAGGNYEKKSGTGTVPESFATDNNGFNELSSNFMSGNTGTMPANHKNTYLSAKFYKLPDVLPSGNDSVDVRILLKPENEIKLDDPANKKWKDKLNGDLAFENNDDGRYVIQYVWVLDDARYTTAYKMLLIQDSDHEVNVKVQDEQGKANDTSLKLYVKEYTGDVPVLKDSDFTKNSVADFSKTEIKTGSKVMLAAKKKEGIKELISKIEMDIHTPDGIVKQVIDNPMVNSDFKFNLTYFYGSYGSGGIYYVKQITSEKLYKFNYNVENGYYYLTLDNEFSKDLGDGNILKRNDLNNDMDIRLTIKSELIPDPDPKPDPTPDPDPKPDPTPTPDPKPDPTPAPKPPVVSTKPVDGKEVNTSDNTDVFVPTLYMLSSCLAIVVLMIRKRSKSIKH